MTRTLHLSRDQARALEEASHYCAKLAAVEHAHILGDEETVDLLLSGVDPIEARLTANVLQSLWRLWSALPEPARGGPDGLVPGSRKAPSPHKVAAVPSSVDGNEQPSAPNIFPQVTHVGDNWSRKAPCS